jgi:hypothetical protein
MKKFIGIDQFYNELASNIQVGTILRRANGWNLNLQVVGDAFRLIRRQRNNYTNVGTAQDHFYYSQASININLGANIINPLNQDEASLSFANKNNAVIIIRNGITTDLYVDELSDDLEQLWYRRNTQYHRDSNNVFLVSSVIQTNRAKVFYSIQNKTSIRLRHRNNLPIATDLDLINADFALNRAVRSVRMMDIHNNCTVMLSLVRWRNLRERFVAY